MSSDISDNYSLRHVAGALKHFISTFRYVLCFFPLLIYYFYFIFLFFLAPQQLSKAALKNKKKREAAKKKREEEGKDETEKQSPGSAPTETIVQSSVLNAELTGNPEKDKKIRNIKKVSRFRQCKTYNSIIVLIYIFSTNLSVFMFVFWHCFLVSCTPHSLLFFFFYVLICYICLGIITDVKIQRLHY